MTTRTVLVAVLVVRIVAAAAPAAAADPTPTPAPPAPAASAAEAGVGAPSAPAKAKAKAVLVEVAGPRPEGERFVSYLLSSLGDVGATVPVDARLSGAKFSDVKNPANPNAGAFRAEWPAEIYVGVTVSACEVKRRQAGVLDRTQNAYGNDVNRTVVIESAEVYCTGEVTVVSAADGKTLASVKADGRMGADGEALAAAEAEGTFGPAWEESAKKAAKKLKSALKAK